MSAASAFGFSHRYVDSGGVRLHVVEAGRGPLVVLLHGFPEFWWSWRRQLEALARAGFHAVAPDMRGYNLSDKPNDVDDYRLGKLSADVAAIVRAFGAEKAYVVGHDWGAIVAWAFAMEFQPMLERLVIVNGPHPAIVGRSWRRPSQLLKSWYVLMFQLPIVPEAFVKLLEWRAIRNALEPDGVPKEDVDEYIEAAKRAGGMHGPICYYRAGIRDMVGGKGPRLRPIEQPVLVVWGEKDRFLDKEAADPGRALAPHLRVEWLPEVSHWVPATAPEALTEAILAFFGRRT